MNSENETTNPHGIKTVFLLGVILLLVLPPFIVFVGRPSPVRSMESICMQTSLETWLRVNDGEPMAWWNPTWDGGVIRIEKPPLLVWLNLAAWHALSPDSATMEQLAFGARLMTILVILLGLAAVFRIGVLLRNIYTGCLAALITGTFFLLVKQAHYATYDAQLMGWATLSVALGLQAICLRGTGGRPATIRLFWVLTGLALGATLMTKGPVGIIWVLGPLILALALLSKAPWRDLPGLCLAAVTGTLILMPWYLHTLHLQSAAISTLADEYKPVDVDQFRPVYYYAGLVAFVFPWTFWWVASWFYPFRQREEGRARFFPSGWFLLSFVFLCVWPMRNPRYLVPLLPAAGLMCAVYLDCAVSHPPWQKIPCRLLRIFWYIAVPISVIIPLFIFMQPLLIAHGLLDEWQIRGISGVGCLAAGTALLLLCHAGIRQSVLPLRKAGFVLVGVWMSALTTFAYYGYSLAEHQFYPWRGQAEDMAFLTSGAPVYYLYETDREHPPKPEMGFTLYALKILRAVTPENLDGLQQKAGGFFLLVPEDSTWITLKSDGFQALGIFQDDDTRWMLMRSKQPAGPSPVQTESKGSF